MRIVSEQDISKLGKHAQSQIRKHMENSSSVSRKMPSPPATKHSDKARKATSKKSKDKKELGKGFTINRSAKNCQTLS